MHVRAAAERLTLHDVWHASVRAMMHIMHPTPTPHPHTHTHTQKQAALPLTYLPTHPPIHHLPCPIRGPALTCCACCARATSSSAARRRASCCRRAPSPTPPPRLPRRRGRPLLRRRGSPPPQWAAARSRPCGCSRSCCLLAEAVQGDTMQGPGVGGGHGYTRELHICMTQGLPLCAEGAEQETRRGPAVRRAANHHVHVLKDRA